MSFNDDTLFEVNTETDSGIFDTNTIRNGWKPIGLGVRMACTHYHIVGIEGWDLVDLCESGVVIATNDQGAMAAVRIRNKELVGIISIIALGKDFENNDLLSMWVDSIAFKLT
ncbi:hypothetical protein SEA_FORZA_53 [Gordonia phage Forza]|uniref:Uncharacterized protein n=1 Tax=Gordonia phage Forza TaxID=2571247 RepID=A0A650EY14_9CAUD|nr:hypothetical protein PP303_gp053 [Gordonia phage Forza]QEM41523.1 hypothetical protein SEA_BOOPY_54 [Gordonia phage Boopy]QGT55046.1 hypothetical protein SEA_FORZA_53 [Gordonia phage Forza]UXE04196.1 hypothetical protein SEA_BLUENGOLD_52 [Gordonia phage BlueNGold]WBF03835.1 hypothetical protein SEA_MAREELIH_52 [Gordonia phage Mareelih]